MRGTQKRSQEMGGAGRQSQVFEGLIFQAQETVLHSVGYGELRKALSRDWYETCT